VSLRINDLAPDFTAQTTLGTIKFHEWIGDSELAVAKIYSMLPAEARHLGRPHRNHRAKKMFPDGWNAPKPYLRLTLQPG